MVKRMTSPDLSGKIAVVTGAGSGIGLATCALFLEHGAFVVMGVHDLNRSRQFVEGLISSYGIKASIYTCDMANYESIDNFVKEIYTKHKRVDVLVNNAGMLKENLIGMISGKEIDESLRVNLAGALHILQGVARIMKRNKSGSIINVSSIVGIKGGSGQLVYSASKAGLLGATYSAAKELASSGIRVNAIAPGLIDTKMTQAFPAERKHALESQIGMGRVGTPEDVADVILFLASDLSRYVTGQVIGVDGGLLI